MTDPPPTGTVLDPVPLVLPLLTAACSDALPHPAGRLLTVMLATLAPDRVWMTLSPALVQRGTETAAAPSEADVTDSDAAAPITDEARPTSKRIASCRHIFVYPSGRAGGYGAADPAACQPLITRATPVTSPAFTAGLKVAAKLVPLDGVVPVASPSDAFAAPDSVIL